MGSFSIYNTYIYGSSCLSSTPTSCQHDTELRQDTNESVSTTLLWPVTATGTYLLSTTAPAIPGGTRPSCLDKLQHPERSCWGKNRLLLRGLGLGWISRVVWLEWGLGAAGAGAVAMGMGFVARGCQCGQRE